MPSASMRSQRSPSVPSVFESSVACMPMRATAMPAADSERSTSAAVEDSTAASQITATRDGRSPAAAIRSAMCRAAPDATSTG